MSEDPGGLYQLLPPLSEDEYAALVVDIQANGIMVPIIVDQHGAVIDGHHRQRIADQLGIPCPKVAREFSSDDERYEFALGLNLKRRHLSREQMRQLIAAECERTPVASDREIARRLGVSHRTVAGVRRPHVDNLSTPAISREEALAMTWRIRRGLDHFDQLCADALKAGLLPATLAQSILQLFSALTEKYNADAEFNDCMWQYVYGPRVEAILSWNGDDS